MLEFKIMVIFDALREGRTDLLHFALSKTDRVKYNLVPKVLVRHGANPKLRDEAQRGNRRIYARLQNERRASLAPRRRFGDEEAVQLLPAAGAKIDAKDMNEESPVSWGVGICALPQFNLGKPVG